MYFGLQSASSVHVVKVFKKHSVDFRLLHKTAAVLLCLAASPKIFYSGGVIDASTICQKVNVDMDLSGIGYFRYRIPPGALAKLRTRVRRLELTVQGWSDRAIIHFDVALNRRSALSVTSKHISGIAGYQRLNDTAEPKCFQAFVPQRAPVAYTFERRNGPLCRTIWPNESQQECPFRCAATHVRRTCGCRLLAGAEQAPADDQWTCVQQAWKTRSDYVHLIRKCWRMIMRSHSAELKRCLTACSEDYCEHEMISDNELGALVKPCRNAFVQRGSNTSVVRFDERTFTRSFDYTFTETPTTNATTIVCLFGGILGE